MKNAQRKSFLFSISGILLLLMILFVSPQSVKAAESDSVVVLESIDGGKADQELKDYLSENGIEVAEGDTISLVRSKTDARAVAVNELKVSHVDENGTLTEYTLTGYDEEEEGMVQADVPVSLSSTRQTNSQPCNFKQNTITMTVSVTFDCDMIYIDGAARAAYRPISSSFRYTRSSSASVTVSYMETTFTTAGALYSTTSSSILQDEYVYYIEDSVSNPAASTLYTRNRSLVSTYRILYTNGSMGSLGEGPMITYTIRFSDGTYDVKDYGMA